MIAVHIAASLHFFHTYPGPWSWTELLIDYQGGFVKRGLLGELAYEVRSLVPPQYFLSCIVFLAYSLAALLLVWGLRIHEEFPGFLFLLNPVGWLFPILTPAAYGRKDSIVFAAICAGLVLVSRPGSMARILVPTMCIFLVAGLCVEIAWFYYPLVFATLLISRREESFRWKLKATAWAGGYTVVCLVLTLLAPPVDTAGIAASWEHVPYVTNNTGALCCLNFGLSTALATSRSALPNLDGYLVAAAFGSVPLILLVCKRPLRWTGWLPFVVLVGAVLVATTPLFLAADWGRYVYLWTVSVFLSCWVASRSFPKPQEDHTMNAYGIASRGAFAVVFASTWQSVHYQLPTLSAFIPGGLFRLLGASGVLPWSE